MSDSKKNKKVLHVITGLSDGGAEGVLTRLCIHGDLVTHEVISLIDKGKYGAILESANVKVYCLGMNPGKPSLPKFFKLIKLIRTIKPDIVQTWMYHSDLLGGLAAKLSGIQKVFWGIRHSILDKDKTKSSTIMIAYLCARLSPFIPNKIICCAHKALDVHADIGYKKDKLIVVSNGYDLTKFKYDPSSGLDLRKEFNIGASEILIGKVGRFDPFKDHSNLLNAMSILMKQGLVFRCILVGKNLTPKNVELLTEITRLGLSDKVILAGQRMDIPAVMNAIDLHVLSSSSEAFPNVLAEAMACGTPCVSTDVGDAKEIISEFGWIVPPQNSEELAKSISFALMEMQNSNAWQKRQHQSSDYIRNNFALQTMIDNFYDVWGVVK